mmetsp:Transcript_105926/g.215981  ORF Transcript_105926/g.215981 Transcript_105926/m.215981 type:complete len:119 (+) Transcript_105926:385-741(+)
MDIIQSHRKAWVQYRQIVDICVVSRHCGLILFWDQLLLYPKHPCEEEEDDPRISLPHEDRVPYFCQKIEVSDAVCMVVSMMIATSITATNCMMKAKRTIVFEALMVVLRYASKREREI